MDLFSRTMLACSAEAGMTTTALSRHVPLLRRSSGPGDQVSLLSRCVGSDGLGSGEYVLMLTGERLVATRQSRLLGRIRLCFDAPIAAVENLRWSADPSGPGVELNFTVLEGTGAAEPHRWHFWLPAVHAKRVWRIDALLARTFRRPRAVARTAAAPRHAAEETAVAQVGAAEIGPVPVAAIRLGGVRGEPVEAGPARPNPLFATSGMFPVVPVPVTGTDFPAAEHPRSPLHEPIAIGPANRSLPPVAIDAAQRPAAPAGIESAQRSAAAPASRYPEYPEWPPAPVASGSHERRPAPVRPTPRPRPVASSAGFGATLTAA